jgi:predicted nuclease with RNAse H fold
LGQMSRALFARKAREKDSVMVWFGADPGGKKNFGVAILRGDGSYSTNCVNCADEAVEQMSERPDGIGIDCPLWWSSSRSSDRLADQWLRAQGVPPGTVQTANSLRGAALVQGAMFAFRARQRYAGVPITEAHPKALLRVMRLHKQPWSKIAVEFGLLGNEPPSEHEWDAVLAAVAARNGVSGAWPHDLSCQCGERELDPKHMWFGEVNYFWPN